LTPGSPGQGQQEHGADRCHRRHDHSGLAADEDRMHQREQGEEDTEHQRSREDGPGGRSVVADLRIR
jgi:hypothetical protein